MSGDEALNEDGTEDTFHDTERRYIESIDRLTEEHLRVVDAYAESLHRVGDLEAEIKKLRKFVAAYDAYREAMDSRAFISQASAATAIRSARYELDRER